MYYTRVLQCYMCCGVACVAGLHVLQCGKLSVSHACVAMLSAVLHVLHVLQCCRVACAAMLSVAWVQFIVLQCCTVASVACVAEC